jgi:hypothetical protein
MELDSPPARHPRGEVVNIAPRSWPSMRKLKLGEARWRLN